MKKELIQQHQLTVGELIEQLSKFPKDRLVFTEGCDCYGKAYSVKEYEINGIMIHREHDKEGHAPFTDDEY
jgi:hypothetical protein